MSSDDIVKNLSINFYNQYLGLIFKEILLQNNKIVKFYLNLDQKSVDDLEVRYLVNLPLFMLSGGEAINLYSDKKKETKDLDIKLIVAGNYSLPKDFFDYADITQDLRVRKIFDNYPIASLQCWKTYMDEGKVELISENYEKIHKYLNLYDLSQKLQIEYHYKIFRNTLDSRKNLFYKILSKFKQQCIQNSSNILQTKNFVPISIDIFFSKNMNIFDKVYNKDINNYYLDENRNYIIPFYIMIPRVQMGWRTEKIGHYPYFIDFGRDPKTNIPNSNIIFNKDNYDEFISFIKNLKLEIETFLNLSEEQDKFIFDMYHDLMSIYRRKRLLSSMVCTKLIYRYNNYTTDWSVEVVDEGILDVWTELSVKYTETTGKKIYDYRLDSGDIPSIIEHIEINNETYVIKIPTINWLIRDQVRMLLHGLRKETIYGQNWTEDTVVEFTENDIDPLKYCDKVIGMIDGYYKVIDKIENNLNEGKAYEYYEAFEPCRNHFDYIECGPDSTLSELFANDFNKQYWNDRLKTTFK